MNKQPITTTHTTEPTLLEAILTRESESRPPLPAGLPLVGDCVDDRHPSLLGRYLVRYTRADGQSVEGWLASLYGLTIRTHDRVMLVRPENWPEPVIMGVLDGFARRPEAAAITGASLELKADEAIRVQGVRGEQLVEIRQSEDGPVVRLLTEDVNLELPGRLKLAARSIDLQATLGSVTVKAADDVTINGEAIHLN